MEDKKTTITGIVTLVASALAWFNIVIPQEYLPVIIAVGVALVSIFAKDGK